MYLTVFVSPIITSDPVTFAFPTLATKLNWTGTSTGGNAYAIVGPFEDVGDRAIDGTDVADGAYDDDDEDGNDVDGDPPLMVPLPFESTIVGDGVVVVVVPIPIDGAFVTGLDVTTAAMTGADDGDADGTPVVGYYFFIFRARKCARACVDNDDISIHILHEYLRMEETRPTMVGRSIVPHFGR